MQSNLIKQWNELTKKANASLRKINELNTKSVKQLTQLQMEMVSSCLEGGVSKAKGVSEVKTVAELINLQSELYKELNQKVMLSAEKSVKLALETKEAMNALIKEGFDSLTSADFPDLLPKATAPKKAPAQKPAAKPAAAKPAAKPAPAKQPAAKKPAAKPAPAKKPAAKPEPQKPVAKKAPAKKAPAKKAAPKMPAPAGRPSTEGDSKK